MTVTLKIEKTVYGGDGLGRLGDGRVAFVPGAYAGETVKAEIVEQKKRFVKTRLVGVEEAIPERLAEKGPTVPGMVYADVAYDAEIRFKQDQLENFLWKVAQTVLPLEVVPAVAPLAYRNKVVYHTERQHGRWVLGYREEPDHRVVDVTQDPLACPAINAALPSIRSAVFTLLTQGARAVRQSAKAADNVTIRHTARDGVKWWLGDPPHDLELREQADGRRFRVSADGFWQVNTAIGDKLLNGSAIRQDFLETALAWIADRDGGDILDYMSAHQHDEDCADLWSYFETVMDWVKKTFPVLRGKLMKGLPWGIYYNKYGKTERDGAALEKRIAQLLRDDEDVNDITNQRGIYEYLLSGDERHLSIRRFSDKMARTAYERQDGKCPKCGKKFAIEEMQADHITPWAKGGKTVAENCQMLCADCNRRKSDV